MRDVLDALERLMRIFQLERALYLVFGLASLVLFLYSGYRMFAAGVPSSADMAVVLGATGVAGACSTRVVYFLNKAFALLEDIVHRGSREGEGK
jgi:hypothetical protein